MQTFLIIWAGQLLSLLGTGMTRFALLIWVYQQTGTATTVALLAFFEYGPYVLVSPFAGIVADRYDRRLVMFFADFCAGLMTFVLLLLFLTGKLQIWHIYLTQAVTSACDAFQVPAYSAAITMLVPKSQYTRVSGLRSLAGSTSTVLAPILGGILLAMIGLSGIMCLDLATLLVALTTLLCVRIPKPFMMEPPESRASGWHALSIVWRYIVTRPGLFGLLLIFMGINLFAALTFFSILPAMILSRTGNNIIALATIQSALGIGGVVGGLLTSTWGGPKKRIHGCLAGAALSFLLGDILFGIGRNVPVWAGAAFIGAMFIPLIDSGQAAIWQAKVAPDIQGRVFAIRNMLQLATFAIGFLLAGPLADFVFEPVMARDGYLAPILGWLVGIGPGAGMGLMFVCTGILGTVMSLSGYLFPTVRNVETELPDHRVLEE